jgi:hypothetical protein
MRARHLQHKQAVFQRGIETSDLSGGNPITYAPYNEIYSVEVTRKAGRKDVEGMQLGQDTIFFCKTIQRAYFPNEIDIVSIEGKNYAISNAWTDDTERIKYLRFTATLRT